MRVLLYWVCVLPWLMPALVEAGEIDELLSMPMGQMMRMKVETASRHVQELADAPANMLVISRKEMDARHYRSLLDVLEDLPGFHVQHHTSSTQYHRISWRGHYGNNKFLLLLDGVRIGDPAGDTVVIADNFSLEHIDRIEVVYGPASALYGADAAAGVINMISRLPRAKHGDLALARGSNHRMRTAALVQAPLGDAASLVLSGHASRDDTTDLARYYPRDFVPVDARTFAGTVVVPAARRERYISPVSANSGFAGLHLTRGLDIGVYHNRSKHLTSIGEKPSGVIYDPSSYWQQDITTVYSRYKRMLTATLESNTLLDVSRLEVSPTSSFRNLFTDFQKGYQYMRNDRVELDQQFSWDLDNAMNLTFGFSMGSYHSIPKTPDTPWPIDPHVAVAAQSMFYPNTNNGVPMQLYDIRYTHWGAFAQHTWHITPRWSTVAGLRYDRDSRYQGSWNPRLGVVYRPVADWTWKLMYGEAFRAPSTVETHETYGSFSGAQNAAGQYTSGFFHLPNPYLQPEKSHTLEASVQGAPTPSLYASLSLYYSRVHNAIFAVPVANPPLMLSNASIATVEINQNIGNERFYGGELYLRQEHEWNHELRGRLWGSYSYLDGRLDPGAGSVAAEIPYVAKHHLRLGLGLDWRSYSLMSNTHFVGKSNTNVADAANPVRKVKVPGYSLYDLHFTARDLWDLGDMDLAIYNLFDRRYYNASSKGIKFPASQQPARTIELTMTIRL